MPAIMIEFLEGFVLTMMSESMSFLTVPLFWNNASRYISNRCYEFNHAPAGEEDEEEDELKSKAPRKQPKGKADPGEEDEEEEEPKGKARPKTSRPTARWYSQPTSTRRGRSSSRVR